MMAKIMGHFRRSVNGDNFDELKIKTGSTALKTAPQFSDAGDDSTPLDTDYAIAVPIPEEGGMVVVGFIDPKNAGITDPGEKRIYSRDGSGVIVCEFYMKGDRSCVLDNGQGRFELESGGDFVINGIRITKAGEIFDANGNSVSGHLHTSALPGSPVTAAYTPPMPPT